MKSPRGTLVCPICGYTRHGKLSTTGSTAVRCGDCRRRIPEPTEKEALPPGEWVLGNGGIRRYVESRPRDLWDLLARNLADIPPETRTCIGALCPDCGCLISVGESCPSCLAWAVRDEIAWSWREAEVLCQMSEIEEAKAA